MRRHSGPLACFALMAVVWTWPLAVHFGDHIPGRPGDNYSFLWNLWWMRTALSSPDLEFFQSNYLFSPFGVDLINHPHTALQGYVSAVLLAKLSIVEAENLYILVSVFLNAACAYALTFDITGKRRTGVLAAIAFGGSPYIGAHLLGHFDLLTAWVIPLFALFFRRSLLSGSIGPAIGAGACLGVAAYSAYYHVVYLGLFAAAYTLAYWDVVHLASHRRNGSQLLFTLRLLIVAAIALDVFAIGVIALWGGGDFSFGSVRVSARSVQNPLLVLWLLIAAWWFTRHRVAAAVRRPEADTVWRGVQALAIVVAAFALVSLPLIVQAFRLAASGRYVTQTYFWRSAPRGVDLLAPALGQPFHPLYGDYASAWYERFGLDRIEAVGWIGIVPIVVLLTARGRWLDGAEARRWKLVLTVFALWALGPFATAGGVDLGLPLPQALARYVPLVENARMPGRAMVVVYLALGVLMGLRLAPAKSLVTWMAVALLALDYLPAPVPLTALDRPVVYAQLASIADSGAVIEVPFGIGDGLSTGQGSQDRRLLYHATIHGHPVVGGYIGRMPPRVAQAYEVMPVVGNLLRLSRGEDAREEDPTGALPFRYLVLDTNSAPPELVDYVKAALDMDLITEGGGRQLYAVQGARPRSLRASR